MGALKALTKAVGPIPLSLLTADEPGTAADALMQHVLQKTAERADAADA